MSSSVGVGMSSGLSMGWAGGQAPIGPADAPPAALMDRPMVRPAQQGQVLEVGGAAIQPVPQMMGLTPGQRPSTAGEATAAVAHRQGEALGGLHDPGGPA